MSRISETFWKIRNSGNTKNVLVFLVFVCIAAVFWLFMALDDDVQDNCQVRLVVEEVPDSVTFIDIPPFSLNVTVRDKGTNLVRSKITGVPEVRLKFADFAQSDVFRVSHSRLSATVRRLFGSTSVISSITPDSLRLYYSTLPGLRVPVVADYDVTAAPGMVVNGHPVLSPDAITLYTLPRNQRDSIANVLTDRIELKNLEKTTTVEVPILAPRNTRAEPSKVRLTFKVEPLVKKESEVAVTPDRVPPGQDILFFPARVKVVYFVPMSLYSSDASSIRVEASFDDAVKSASDKVAIKVVGKAPYMNNVELLSDSVEYTLVRSN